jgi:Kef-type K+ transport system membrane component KefB
MYIAGLELDFDRLSGLSRKELASYGGFSVLLVAGSFAAVFILKLPIFFAVIIMTCALGLLFTVLKDLNLVHTQLGQTMILLGAVGEIITLVGFIVVSIAARGGGAQETLISIASVACFVAVIYLGTRVMRLVLWWNPELMHMFMSTGTPSEIGVRANIFNMFIFVGLALLMGVEDILGAFFGGLIFAKLFADRSEMLEKLSGFAYGFLIPIFFIEVGSRFKFADFLSPSVLTGALTLSLAMFVVRFVAAGAFRLTNMPKHQLVLVPFALSFPLTLLLAGASLGETNGLIEHHHSSIIVLAAIISAIFYPWIMKVLVRVTLK